MREGHELKDYRDEGDERDERDKIESVGCGDGRNRIDLCG